MSRRVRRLTSMGRAACWVSSTTVRASRISRCSRTTNSASSLRLDHRFSWACPTRTAWRSFLLAAKTGTEGRMKRHTWISWTITGLMAALMLLSAVPDVLRVPDALSVFKHLGYPSYLLLFLGTAKILGVAAVLVPGFPRIKEWAFAGLMFDVSGALYSHLS